jgi:hypothetical protein
MHIAGRETQAHFHIEARPLQQEQSPEMSDEKLEKMRREAGEVRSVEENHSAAGRKP